MTGLVLRSSTLVLYATLCGPYDVCAHHPLPYRDKLAKIAQDVSYVESKIQTARKTDSEVHVQMRKISMK